MFRRWQRRGYRLAPFSVAGASICVDGVAWGLTGLSGAGRPGGACQSGSALRCGCWPCSAASWSGGRTARRPRTGAGRAARGTTGRFGASGAAWSSAGLSVALGRPWGGVGGVWAIDWLIPLGEPLWREHGHDLGLVQVRHDPMPRRDHHAADGHLGVAMRGADPGAALFDQRVIAVTPPLAGFDCVRAFAELGHAGSDQGVWAQHIGLGSARDPERVPPKGGNLRQLPEFLRLWLACGWDMCHNERAG